EGIFHIMPVTKQAAADGEDHWPVRAEQFFKGSLIAARDKTLDQLGVRCLTRAVRTSRPAEMTENIVQGPAHQVSGFSGASLLPIYYWYLQGRRFSEFFEIVISPSPRPSAPARR